MKKIVFKQLRLLNFCGIREADYGFIDGTNIFEGGNGVGKTTIANAITYVLFGTNLRGEKFDIKTYDAQHNIIPEIPHEAELILLVDDDEIRLKRTLMDSWDGKEVKNTYKYYVNGDVTTAGDYLKEVNKICNEITFRLSSSCTYFLSKSWQEQRAILQSMVPEISTDRITSGDEKFDFVVKALEKENLEKVIGHIKYKRNEIQEQLDKIPTKLDVLNKALPKQLNWDALEEKQKELKEKYDNLQNQASTIEKGGADMVREEGLRHRIQFNYKRKGLMESSARKESGDAEVKHGSDLITARTSKKKAEATVSELQSLMDGYTESEINAKEQVENCKQEVNELNDQQTSISSRKWKWNDEDSKCPHCGQPLPNDKLEEIKNTSQELFNNQKAKELKKIQDKFAKVQENYKKAKQLITQIEQDRIQTTNQLVDAQKSLKEAVSHLEKVEKEVVPTADDILSKKEEYVSVVAEIKKLEEELNKPSELNDEDKEMLKKVNDDIISTKKEIQNLDTQIASKDNYDRVSKLIGDTQIEKKKYQEQLDAIDKKLNIANEYQYNSCKALEEEVNKHFSFVQFSLFKPNLDGVEKPYCECYHNGVPYSTLNDAAKVNAGIDIAYAIAKHYDVSVPIIIDNCESINDPITNNNQQIRFYATKDKELKQNMTF